MTSSRENTSFRRLTEPMRTNSWRMLCLPSGNRLNSSMRIGGRNSVFCQTTSSRPAVVSVPMWGAPASPLSSGPGGPESTCGRADRTGVPRGGPNDARERRLAGSRLADEQHISGGEIGDRTEREFPVLDRLRADLLLGGVNEVALAERAHVRPEFPPQLAAIGHCVRNARETHKPVRGPHPRRREISSQRCRSGDHGSAIERRSLLDRPTVGCGG